jgi:hypothetical protein
VNFLFHHHLAKRDLGSDAGALGAMLPDVWRMADRRAHLREHDSTAEGEALNAVLEGVAHHMAVDARFHAASVFTEGERATRDALRGASRAPKLSLFAHVGWELCLDGALVRRVGLEALLDTVRASVASVGAETTRCAAFMSAPSLRAFSEEERERFDLRVARILDAIALGPWVAGYATGAGVVERLEGVRTRLRLAPLPEADRGAVGSALEKLANRADVAVDEITSWGSSARPTNLTLG